MYRQMFYTCILILLSFGSTFGQAQPIHLESSTCFVVQPQDCNHNYPMLFGGKSLAEMDRCAGITMRRLLYASPLGAKDAVTIAINGVKFYKAGEVKDLVVVTGKVVKVGEKSATIKITLEKETKDGKILLADAEYVFVSYDLDKKEAIPHGIKLPVVPNLEKINPWK